jgi:alpha-L-rhamnosidase
MTERNGPGAPTGLRAPSGLRCEYFTNPLGIDEPQPRLSWLVNDPRRGARQTAYEILVAASAEALADDDGDVWDSGKVESDQSVHVEYAGPALEPRQRYWWKVRTWDAAGAASPWSEAAWWEMGLRDSSEWTGEWIGGPPTDGTRSIPSPYLRRTFECEGKPARARLYVTARGLHETYINGRRVGQDHFCPGWTDYSKRIQYQTYDVTGLVRDGGNAIGSILGEGWYSGYLGWQDHRNVYGKNPSLLLQLVLEYAGGGTQTIASDETWRAATGPIRASDIYNGETCDARLEMDGWCEPDFDDGAWRGVHVYEPTDALLVAKKGPPVRAIQEVAPVEMTEPGPGVFIYDLGQNLVGRCRLTVDGEAGTTVRLRHAEMLEPDGTLYTDNLRSARCTDEYTLKGDGPETYEPRFTFHGFRYVEVTGLPEAPAMDCLTAVVLHSDTPPTGTFECSDPLIKQLQHNIVWGQKGNFLEVPTDCPQRDERLGWTGDAQVFVRTACFNMDVAAFFTKWLDDVADSQSAEGAFPDVVPNVLSGFGHAAWSDAGIICPWTVYLCYGDVRVLERHYDSMAAWIECMRRTGRDLIRPDDGYGDWLATEALHPGGAHTPKELIGTAYFAYCTQIMASVARILGRDEDAADFEALLEEVRAAFSHEFVTPGGRVVGNTQTADLLALAFDLLPEEHRPAVLDHLIHDLEKHGWHLSTGFVGTPLLAPTLSRFGRADAAYRLLKQDTYPSWLYTVKQGATTMWERWDSWTEERGFQTPGMNSFNHYAYGAIGQWMYATVAGLGLDPLEPGCRHAVIRPEPGGGLTHARAELQSVYGPVASGWEVADGTFRLRVGIPANARATVFLPGEALGAAREGDVPLAEVEGVTKARVEHGRIVCDVGAGSYEFTVPMPEVQ